MQELGSLKTCFAAEISWLWSNYVTAEEFMCVRMSFNWTPVFNVSPSVSLPWAFKKEKLVP